VKASKLRPTILATVVLLAAASTAHAALPRPARGLVVPGGAIAGVSLGDTKEQMIARWGRPNRCDRLSGAGDLFGEDCNYGPRGATWPSFEVALFKWPGSPGLQVHSMSWSGPELRGWRARGVGMGSPWRQFAAAFPNRKPVTDIDFGRVRENSYRVATRLPDGRNQVIEFIFSARAGQWHRRGELNRVVVFLSGPLCSITKTPAPGPINEPDGFHLTGHCFGTDMSYYMRNGFRLRSTTPGVAITSIAGWCGAERGSAQPGSTFEKPVMTVPTGETVCKDIDGGNVWAVDIRIGLSGPGAALEMWRPGAPNVGAAEFRLSLP
jgi:hypothetical protein